MATSTRTVVCFGDSNTYGSQPMASLDDIRRYPTDQRWTGRLAALLGPSWTVIEEGLPGRTTVHRDPIEGAHLCGLDAVPMIIGSHSPIDVVVLYLGVNDYKTRFSVTAADIATSLVTLIADIRRWSQGPGRTPPQMVVIAPPTILETGCLAGMYQGGRIKSEQLPPLLRERVTDLDVAFVDAGAHIRSSAVDGIHLDADQQDTLAQVIAAQITGDPTGP